MWPGATHHHRLSSLLAPAVDLVSVHELHRRPIEDAEPKDALRFWRRRAALKRKISRPLFRRASCHGFGSVLGFGRFSLWGVKFVGQALNFRWTDAMKTGCHSQSGEETGLHTRPYRAYNFSIESKLNIEAQVKPKGRKML